MKKAISLFLWLAVLFSLSSCNSSDKPVVTGEGVYGDYVVISIDDYIDMAMIISEMETRLELARRSHNCLEDNDLVITTTRADDGFYYWLILCEECQRYTLIFME